MDARARGFSLKKRDGRTISERVFVEDAIIDILSRQMDDSGTVLADIRENPAYQPGQAKFSHQKVWISRKADKKTFITQAEAVLSSLLSKVREGGLSC